MSKKGNKIYVGIVGSGTVAGRRAEAIRNVEGLALVAVAEIRDHEQDFTEQGKAFAQQHGCSFVTYWDELVKRDDLDIIIVATINSLHAPIGMAAIEHGKHVLIEKPLACSVKEAQQLLAAAKLHQRLIKTGFNHRHHPWVQKVHDWRSDGRLGQPFWARALIGHAGMLGGGRPNFERTFFNDPDKAGGGTLLDNGVHAHDLVRWLLGLDFAEALGWTIKANSAARVEDNAGGVFKTADGKCLYVHQSSWTHWGHYFVLELSGTEGYLSFDYGLGSATYIRPVGGRERLQETVSFDLKAPDQSWALELSEFRNAIWENRKPLGNGEDGLEALVMSEALYRSSRTGRSVRLEEVRHASYHNG